MKNDEVEVYRVTLIVLFVLITGTFVSGDSLQSDKETLLNLKTHLENRNRVNQGKYATWHSNDTSPCAWDGISCSGNRVTGVDLSNDNISGDIFPNFSALTALTNLDLSSNTIDGGFPLNLSQCNTLKRLNLSSNIISGELNLTGFKSLEILDLSTNRIFGEIKVTFPEICKKLVLANLSSNNLTGHIDNSFDKCSNLQYLDIGSNYFSGEVWSGFDKLKEFSISENYFSGALSGELFGNNCSLKVLDLSGNGFQGNFPKEISNCQDLENLNLWGNNFTGEIPSEIGNISGLKGLYLGNNSFSRTIPETLLDLKNLTFLDLSRNHFGDEIQPIFGRFTQIKYLVLHSNYYTTGIYSSGILNLSNLSRLDLSFNHFTGPLPTGVSQMRNLDFFILAYNQFSGNIPIEYGHLPSLQSLDLSYNNLNGSIPSSLGNLSSLLWLMLANNELSGEIPRELGNCRSLLWLNLENNRLSGAIPSEITKIGLDATSTFEKNREKFSVIAGSGECLAMKRWIPADYPPFSFVYTLFTIKSCRNIWDRILKGYGLFPFCVDGKRTFQTSGYIQLSRNNLSGEIPIEIEKMQNFSMIHIGFNEFSGNLPVEIAKVPLINLNLTRNKFTGKIPKEIGEIMCLQNLDLSYNNFSGEFPPNFNNLTELTMFNISYNPYITGTIPTTGQLATFEKESFLGDPLLTLPSFMNNSDQNPKGRKREKSTQAKKNYAVLVFFGVTLTFLLCIIATLIVCGSRKQMIENYTFPLENQKGRDLFVASSSSSSDTVKVIRLDKTAFTYIDILNATSKFSDERIIGKGGFGTVYRGLLPDGREIAVKKLQREGKDGEREFRAEMEVLSGNGFGWPHPNLVTLYGWCLNGYEKLLVYEYICGGSLDHIVSDRMRLKWKRRLYIAIDVARALVFLHHECDPPIVHRDVKASNVLLDKDGNARVTDFGLSRVVDDGGSHVSTMVAGTVGYVAPEYCHTWQATTKGDVYSFGVLAMELATARRAVSGGEECLVEWARRVVGPMGGVVSPKLLRPSVVEGAEAMCELLKIAMRCTSEVPQVRPNMKEVLAMLVRVGNQEGVL